MRHELIEQLLAGDAEGETPGPSALDLQLDLEPAEFRTRVNARADRALTAFDVADEDAEARSFARRRLVGVALAGGGSAVALLGALAVGL